jgi:hypothetical protein
MGESDQGFGRAGGVNSHPGGQRAASPLQKPAPMRGISDGIWISPRVRQRPY